MPHQCPLFSCLSLSFAVLLEFSGHESPSWGWGRGICTLHVVLIHFLTFFTLYLFKLGNAYTFMLVTANSLKSMLPYCNVTCLLLVSFVTFDVNIWVWYFFPMYVFLLWTRDSIFNLFMLVYKCVLCQPCSSELKIPCNRLFLVPGHFL